MPLVFAENEATESGISYDDRTGISYQYPGRYRRLIQPGERFVYYRGRRSKDGRRVPQVYFGTGVVGRTSDDPRHPNRFVCGVLDYRAFSEPIPFKNANGQYLETGADRRGYFQPGVREISEADFERIIRAAEEGEVQVDGVGGALEAEPGRQSRPGYASQAMLRAVEEFAVRVALKELRRRYPDATVQVQPRNNPGFDIIVRQPLALSEPIYVEIKGTTRGSAQFMISEGEREFSCRNQRHYKLIVVYAIRIEAETYELLWHEGEVSLENGFRLDPIQWGAQWRSSDDSENHR